MSHSPVRHRQAAVAAAARARAEPSQDEVERNGRSVPLMDGSVLVLPELPMATRRRSFIPDRLARSLVSRAGAVALVGAVVLSACGGADDMPDSGRTPTATEQERVTQREQVTATSRPGSETGEAAPSTVEVVDDWVPAPTDEVTSLRIDSIDLEHQLIPQGVDDQGRINPASGELIWFTGYDRVSPGLPGTSVIAGHVMFGDAPDVFIDLAGVAAGDTLTLEYAGGHQVTAVVQDTFLVDKDELPHDPVVWGANSNTRRIVLITCDDALGYQSDGHRVANFVAVAEVTAG